MGRTTIHGELLKLGIDVGQTTVAKYMARGRRPPSQGWKTFLRVIVVTGGSSGIGAEAVQQFAELGADVVIGYHANEAAAHNLLKHLPAAQHGIARLALKDSAFTTLATW